MMSFQEAAGDSHVVWVRPCSHLCRGAPFGSSIADFLFFFMQQKRRKMLHAVLFFSDKMTDTLVELTKPRYK